MHDRSVKQQLIVLCEQKPVTVTPTRVALRLFQSVTVTPTGVALRLHLKMERDYTNIPRLIIEIYSFTYKKIEKYIH